MKHVDPSLRSLPEMDVPDRDAGILLITGQIVEAWLGRLPMQDRPVSGEVLSDVIMCVRLGLSLPVADALTKITGGAVEVEKPTAAEIRKSITPDALISFIDGKPYKTLKRHLTGHGLDPQSYRLRYSLPADYPMVAANYATKRSELAKSLGLGRTRPSLVEAA